MAATCAMRYVFGTPAGAPRVYASDASGLRVFFLFP